MILLLGVYLLHVPIRGTLSDIYTASTSFVPANLTLGLVISTTARTQFQAVQMMIFISLPSVLHIDHRWCSADFELTHEEPDGMRRCFGTGGLNRVRFPGPVGGSLSFSHQLVAVNPALSDEIAMLLSSPSSSASSRLKPNVPRHSPLWKSISSQSGTKCLMSATSG
ncbi:MAG: hypothetical protein BMS9Abin36_2197 [Gammaproteobacteria bacterium]|nr:MAG: hypothetical protein BMS9Abin36_2197 [Gammaproteobacteria bacterium]